MVLALVYYECPMLCTQILNGVESSLKAVTFDPGRDFEVVAVSFDPKDTPELAGAKKHNYLRRYGRAGHGQRLALPHRRPRPTSRRSPTRWASATVRRGRPSSSRTPAASTSPRPHGRLSHYFYGVEYSPRDLRLGLVEASKNKIGNPVDQLLLFCYHYDPATGKYGAIAMNIVRLAGVVFLLICGAFLFFLLAHGRRAAAARRHGR